MSENQTPGKNLRNRQVTILVPGTFSFLHYGHFRLFEDCKSSFNRVRLIVGIHDSSNSLLTPEEKALTLSHIAAVDEVILHLPRVNRQLMNKHRVDYVAVWTEEKKQSVVAEEVLCMPGYPHVTTFKLADRIHDEEEDFVMHILEDELEAWECGMSKAQLHWIEFKRKLRKKAAEWFPHYIEVRQDRAANYRLQQIVRRSTRYFSRLLKISPQQASNYP